MRKTIGINLTVGGLNAARSAQAFGIFVAIVIIASGGDWLEAGNALALCRKCVQQSATHQCLADAGVGASDKVAHLKTL
jgi:hypothetical protein